MHNIRYFEYIQAYQKAMYKISSIKMWQLFVLYKLMLSYVFLKILLFDSFSKYYILYPISFIALLCLFIYTNPQ